MSESAPKRSAADIEADLQRTREELTKTVNELSDRLNPKTNAKAAADQAKLKANEFVASARGVADDAGRGEPSAIGILAAAAATVALAGYLMFKK
ncbi:DUF3618 domain-containing protein [Flaviflexus massiliensis]|uniref:DUF3618 domain-containing protein n=1 Tax=Flaviflexus massiliensis TaxID=1522309 RepID=UPI0006D59E18|nr:DUF3618 domain-containing protein [Flaviflexus massiliensis]